MRRPYIVAIVLSPFFVVACSQAGSSDPTVVPVVGSGATQHEAHKLAETSGQQLISPFVPDPGKFYTCYDWDDAPEWVYGCLSVTHDTEACPGPQPRKVNFTAINHTQADFCGYAGKCWYHCPCEGWPIQNADERRCDWLYDYYGIPRP